MTSYADTAALTKQQRIPPIVGWEAASKMLEQWLVVVTVLLGPQERHPSVFELATLLEAGDEVNPRLRAQAAFQQDIPEALVQLIQNEFNKSFRQVFTSHLPVRWPHFNTLIRTLTKRHFHPDTVTIQGGVPAQPTNRHHATPDHSPTLQKINSAEVRRAVYRHITGGGTKSSTTAPPPSRTGVQTLAVHGTSREGNRLASAIDR